jgi:stage II sporulation protein D
MGAGYYFRRPAPWPFAARRPFRSILLRTINTSQRLGLAALAAASLGLITSAPAQGATTIVAKGAGYGHGIGMSQWGAYGQAKAGRSYTQILATYYKGTAISKGSTDRTIRVLLRNASSVRFSGAASVAGSTRKLSPKATYVMKTVGANTVLTSSKGKTLATASGAMRAQAAPGGAVRVAGAALNGISSGRYRGAVELRGTMVINQVLLEDYVRGVISGESPSSWPHAALEAQAIAARTYAVTGSRSAAFDVYPDTRSQMYKGVASETTTTNAATAVTAGRFVTYAGKPIQTFFFSSSGGRTENVENSFLGGEPKPYLTSVADPWDKYSPQFRWQVKYTRASLQRKLGGWVKGSLRSIDIIKTGVSPRIVRADVVGSGGRTTVTGPQLRTRLGLNDTWVQFIFNGATTAPAKTTPAPSSATTPGTGGGVTAQAAGLASVGAAAPSTTPSTTPAVPGTQVPATTIGAGLLSQVVAQPPGFATARGRVWPDGGGHQVRLQTRADGRWRTQLHVTADADGNWNTLIPVGTKYRVVGLGVAGPIISAK